jgi:hypothetical protein
MGERGGVPGQGASGALRFGRVLIPGDNLSLPVRRWLLQRRTAWIHAIWGLKLTLVRGRMVTRR